MLASVAYGTMESMRSCTVLRVFTRGDQGGNRLGVVTDLSGLDSGSMQAIAREVGFSETIFLELDARPVPVVRIFTPSAELPFAGHPLVGCAWYLAKGGGSQEGVLKCEIGEVPYRVEGDAASVSVARTADVKRVDGAELASRCRLPVPLKTWVVNVPQPYTVMDVGSESTVASAEPDFGELARWDAVYLFARTGNRARVRFFAPFDGVDEDPATGSAAFALASMLSWEGEASGALAVSQGAEVGFPCRIEVAWEGEFVRLGGTVRDDGPISVAS